MEYHDLVSLRTCLADPSYDEANVRLRVKYLDGGVLSAARPEGKLEVEAMAAK